jgi:hypothetical protein
MRVSSPTQSFRPPTKRMYDDVTLCMMMWHGVWWCDTMCAGWLVYVCMMMWHYAWWCDTAYDDVTLCMRVDQSFRPPTTRSWTRGMGWTWKPSRFDLKSYGNSNKIKIIPIDNLGGPQGVSWKCQDEDIVQNFSFFSQKKRCALKSARTRT